MNCCRRIPRLARVSFALFLAACAGAPPTSAPSVAPTPPLVLSTADLPVVAGFPCRELTSSVDVFRYEVERVRDLPWYQQLGADNTVEPSAGMTADSFAKLVRELRADARAIADVRVRRRLQDELDLLLQGARDGELKIGGRVLLDRWNRRDSITPGVRGYFEVGAAGREDVSIPFTYDTDRPDRHGAYMSEADAQVFVAITGRVARAIELNLPLLKVTQQLQANDTAWGNYLDRGYPQFPWEGVLNGFAVRSAWDSPPTGQFVLLHPEVGVVLDVERLRTSTFEPALLVHGLGYLHYFDDDRGWFLGASASLSLTGEEDVGMGYGITLHGGSTAADSALPHVSVGLLWREGDDDGFQVAIGIDLLKLLKRSK